MSDADVTVTEPDHPEVRAFWDVARMHANLNAAPSYFGPTPLESVPPPAWSYGATPPRRTSSSPASWPTRRAPRRPRWPTTPARCPRRACSRSCATARAGRGRWSRSPRSRSSGDEVRERFRVVYRGD